jgi:Rrf2 family transcriptional regulator, iron-sulfur cluster assembly transcription factor
MMEISTKGRYACRIMVLLAGRSVSRPMSKHEISAVEGLTADYVQQIMQRLRAAGLVRSHRGKTGGFTIARDPASLSVGKVLAAVEGRVSPAPCVIGVYCERCEGCPTRPVWMRAATLVDELFAGTMIAGLAPH